MSMYKVFTRNWWKIENGKKVPAPRARKTTLGYADDITEAREMCAKYNDSHAEGPLSRKAEFTSSF